MKKKRWHYDMRCCYCGRFVKHDADSSTPYGRVTDIDMPDDEYYCGRCAARYKVKYIEICRVPVEYRLAKWQVEVMKALEDKGIEMLAMMG